MLKLPIYSERFETSSSKLSNTNEFDANNIMSKVRDFLEGTDRKAASEAKEYRQKEEEQWREYRKNNPPPTREEPRAEPSRDNQSTSQPKKAKQYEFKYKPASPREISPALNALGLNPSRRDYSEKRHQDRTPRPN